MEENVTIKISPKTYPVPERAKEADRFFGVDIFIPIKRRDGKGILHGPTRIQGSMTEKKLKKQFKQILKIIKNSSRKGKDDV